MCTLSIFPGATEILVTMNRDEAIAREEGLPFQQPTGADDAPARWYGVDAATGGSWFGVNQHGLVAVLLNRYQESNPLAVRSRGVLVPGLLQHASLRAALAWANRQHWPAFAPCDVLMLQQRRLALLRWTGAQLAQRWQRLHGPLFRTSSSLDYPQSRALRVAAFQTFRRQHPDPSADQVVAELHRQHDSRWPERSILMQRADRHTKSLCQVALGAAGIRARYLPRAVLDAGELSHRPWDLSWP